MNRVNRYFGTLRNLGYRPDRTYNKSTKYRKYTHRNGDIVLLQVGGTHVIHYTPNGGVNAFTMFQRRRDFARYDQWYHRNQV